jgi:cytochrome P450
MDSGTLTGAPPLYPPRVQPAKGDLPLWGVVSSLLNNPLRILPEAVFHEPIVTTRRLGLDIVWVTDPALIMTVLLAEVDTYEKTELEKRVLGPNVENGLLSATGANWRWQRKIGAPLFRNQDILAHVPQMSAAAERQIAAWQADPPPAGTTRDIEPDMKETSFGVISSTILAGCNADEAAAIKRTELINSKYMHWDIATAALRWPSRLWYPHKKLMTDAAMDTRTAMMRLIARRRSELADKPANDLLGRLIVARHPDTDAPISDAQVCDNMMSYLEAGHETTGSALTWAMYMLARSPTWQDQVRAEVQAVVGSGPVEARHIEGLEVTTRGIKETLRLFPGLPTMVRITTKETALGGKTLPKGALVFVVIYATHRHHALWDDPDRFDPDRFLPEREAAMRRGQYLPFSAGQRICLGNNFALTEVVTVIASFVRALRIEWDGHYIPEPVTQVNLRPSAGMPLRLTLL